MSSENYKLIYSNFRARAEPIRFIFALADVPYVDFRFEEWTQELKNATPWGQVPVLEINGKRLAQSSAICRYLARKYNLTGADDFEAAKCDELVDAMMDLRAEWKLFFFEPDIERKEILRKTLVEVSFAKYFTKFEKIIADSEGDLFFGKNVTWADLHIASTLEMFTDSVPGASLDGYPILLKFQKAVFNIPRIKAWIAKRPKTER